MKEQSFPGLAGITGIFSSDLGASSVIGEIFNLEIGRLLWPVLGASSGVGGFVA